MATALKLVDEHGVPAFSLRMLADTLNSGTAMLYRHFESKDEIVAHIVNRVLGEVELPHLKPDAPWQDVLSAMDPRFYEVLRRHPNVVPALIAQVPVGPHGLALRERVLRTLLERGMPADLAARAFTAAGTVSDPTPRPGMLVRSGPI
ncbi:TetR/AcrR family transcriptional regulator [Streptomyces sp. NPDC056479]|uniref:TetR/AcrR family transcriptional regulator n=1 Tax=unclassified Streptomyces TaxID=2593676 RepID=UPI0036CD2F75